MAQRVKINRSERRPPFLSNIVPGGAHQVVPNGNAYDQDPMEGNGIQGSGNQQGFSITVGPVPATKWPSGNRSGE